MGKDLSIHITILYTDTSIDGIKHWDLLSYFPRIMVTRHGRNRTLLDACQHGYVIQCAPPHCNEKNNVLR